MSQYSISDLEELTGIRAHTIRAWEQRYQLLNPERSEGNTRYYNDEELRHLLSISALLSAGSKISALSRLSKKELQNRMDQLILDKTQSSDSHNNAIIHQLIDAGLRYDELLFEKAFSAAVLKYGLVSAYEKIIYPMLVRVGLLWGKSDLLPAQEHFISNLLKQKLFYAIEQCPVGLEAKETWLLFLPEEEDHEIALLIAAFLLRSSGRRVVYLGQRVPLANLSQAVKVVKPDYLMCFVVRHFPGPRLQEMVDTMTTDFRSTKKVICGSVETGRTVQLRGKSIWVSDLHELTKLLARES